MKKPTLQSHIVYAQGNPHEGSLMWNVRKNGTGEVTTLCTGPHALENAHWWAEYSSHHRFPSGEHEQRRPYGKASS